MNWREAFIRQSRSDNAVRRRLNQPGVEYSHRLHYLQMVTEKLSKAMQLDPNDFNPPARTHRGLVRLLQVLKGRPEFRERFGYSDTFSFRAFIDSLLDFAGQIERLAPDLAGLTQPNTEYPWRNPATGDIHVPAEFGFEIFNPRDPRMLKIERLIDALLRIL